MNRVVIFTALRAETEENIEGAGFNAEAVEKTTKGGIPGLQQYRTTVWTSVAGSDAILSLPPNDFSNIALLYGQLIDANRVYTVWDEKFTLTPFSFRTLSEHESRAWETYRAGAVKGLAARADAIRHNLPVLKSLLDSHLAESKAELVILAIQSRPLQIARISIAVAGVLAFVYLFFAAIAERTRQKPRP